MITTNSESMGKLAIAIQQYRNAEPLTEFTKEFIEGAIFGTNVKLDEALLLIQSKLGYDDPTFAIVRRILLNLKEV